MCNLKCCLCTETLKTLIGSRGDASLSEPSVVGFCAFLRSRLNLGREQVYSALISVYEQGVGRSRENRTQRKHVCRVGEDVASLSDVRRRKSLSDERRKAPWRRFSIQRSAFINSTGFYSERFYKLCRSFICDWSMPFVEVEIGVLRVDGWQLYF